MKSKSLNTLGYFGFSKFDCAKALLHQKIKSLKLFINQEKETFLMLQGIEFYSNGGKIDLTDIEYITYISGTNQSKSANGLLEKKVLKTEIMKRPYWIIEFSKPIYIAEVFIYNKGTNYRDFRRNKNLCLEYKDSDGLTQGIKLNKYKKLKDIAITLYHNSETLFKSDLLYNFAVLQAKEMKLDKFYIGSKHFGSTQETALSLSLNYKVKEIEIFIENTTLALSGLEFLYKNEIIKLDSSLYTLSQSSVWKGREAKNLLQNKKIHTTTKPKSYWKIQFYKAEFIDTLRIYNRKDKYTSRNINLKIVVLNENNHKAIYSPNYDNYHPIFNKIINEQREKDYYLSLISFGIQNQIINIDSINWLELMNHLDLWSEEKKLNKSELIILSAYLLSTVKKGNNGSKKISFLAARLRTGKEIDILQKNINELSKKLNRKEYLISKHGLTTPRLINQKETYLKSLNELFQDLKTLDYQIFIAFGTLLGVARNNSFIPHDDDIDLVVIMKSNNESDAKKEFQNVMNSLSQLNYKTYQIGNNIHVQKKGLKRLDIFLSWVNEETFHLLGVSKKYEINKKDILPLRKVFLYDLEIFAPQNIEAHLVKFYGDNWGKVEKFFGWPWKLTNNENSFLELDYIINLEDLEKSIIKNLQEKIEDFFIWHKHSKLLVIEYFHLVIDINIINNNDVLLYFYNKKENQTHDFKFKNLNLQEKNNLVYNIKDTELLDIFTDNLLNDIIIQNIQ